MVLQSASDGFSGEQQTRISCLARRSQRPSNQPTGANLTIWVDNCNDPTTVLVMDRAAQVRNKSKRTGTSLCLRIRLARRLQWAGRFATDEELEMGPFQRATQPVRKLAY